MTLTIYLQNQSILKYNIWAKFKNTTNNNNNKKTSSFIKFQSVHPWVHVYRFSQQSNVVWEFQVNSTKLSHSSIPAASCCGQDKQMDDCGVREKHLAFPTYENQMQMVCPCTPTPPSHAKTAAED